MADEPTVQLPGMIAVVPTASLITRLSTERVQGRDDLDVERLVDQFRQLSVTGIPARLDTDTDTDRTTLRLYTDTHVALLTPTRRGDAYLLTYVSRWGFADHDNVARGVLRISCPGWILYPEIRQVRPGHRAYLDTLRRAWTTVVSSPTASSRLPARHHGYLDLVTSVVEQTRLLERRRLAASTIVYSGRTAARERRYSARGVYTFRLADLCQIQEGSRVQVGDDRELRGMVLRAESLTVVVRFDGVPDYGRIPAQGSLTVLPSDVIYRAQLAAVSALREGKAANPRLLTALAEHRIVQTARPDRSARPGRGLDAGQLEAYQRALGDPDLLLVLGPPGTGKTWTITEIATAEARRVGRGGTHRVLVTSHSNQAVDNVLTGLAGHLRCVRAGNPEAMTGPARRLTVEAQVEELTSTTLRNTEPTAYLLAPFAQAADGTEPRLALLRRHIVAAREADDLVRVHDHELDDLASQLRAPFEPQLAAAGREAERLESEAANHRGRRDRARSRHDSAAARQASGWWAAVRRWSLDRRLRALQAAQERLAEAEHALAAAHAQLAEVLDRIRLLVPRHPDGARLLAERERAWGARARALTGAGRVTEPLRAELERAGCPPQHWSRVDRSNADAPEAGERNDDDLSGHAGAESDAQAEIDGWERRHEALTGAVDVARARAALLDEWRTRIPAAEEALQRELLGYADVIAATCIGVATKQLLGGLEFDLAIVDEAGQISAPNLLVPLVRARRAVLVGDHKQLPPYREEDLAAWADERAAGATDAATTTDAAHVPGTASEIGEIVRRSEFERLFDRIDADHRVTLTVQRRMPPAVADFISRAFYAGTLQTDHPGTGGDPLFTSPLAFVDTSDRPPTERRETKVAGGGIGNDLEARLIAELLARHAGQHGSWAVIVPYREQVRRIRRRLVDRLGDPGMIDDNVGTVDSFQGNERDLIIYGFTRSNRTGSVGFLSELRRLNVAMTRTRRQLVLVGDLETLGHARDAGFAELVAQLRTTLTVTGDLRPSREIEARLRGSYGGAR